MPLVLEKFQLHHTGIKTWRIFVLSLFPLYFNCTIQELKRARKRVIMPPRSSFQLHHTGIKTSILRRRA